MTLSTGVAATQGTALTLEWPDTPFNPMAKARIHDVEIRGADFDPTLATPPAMWWNAGINIKNSGGLDISHVNILGNVFQSHTALKCETVGSSVFRHFISNLFVRWFDVGVDWAGPVEGVYMNNFELVACRIGFRAIASVPGTGGTVWHLANGHMDCREVCFQATNHTIIKLTSIAFFHTGNNPPRLNANMVQFEHCQWITVSACSFLGFFEAPDFTPLTAQNGIVATNCDEVLLTGNHIDLIRNYAMIFGVGTIRAHARSNRAVAVGGRWLNQGDAMNTDDALGE
jgi:hypothetical protein